MHIEALRGKILEHGGQRPFVIWKTDCMDTRRQFMISDPDGYVLRFAQSLGTRPVDDSDLRNLNEQ